MLQYNVSRMFKFLEKTIKQEAEMFHKMLDLKGIEKEVQKYRYKIEDAELFIPEDWIPEDFTLEDLRRILIKSIETNKKFEEFMPSKYKEHLKNYMEGIKKRFIY